MLVLYCQATLLAQECCSEHVLSARSFRGQEKGDTGQNPVLLVGVLALHSDIEHGHKVCLTSIGGEVNGAVIHADGRALALPNRSDVDDRELRRKFLQDHVAKVALLTVASLLPASSFE